MSWAEVIDASLQTEAHTKSLSLSFLACYCLYWASVITFVSSACLLSNIGFHFCVVIYFHVLLVRHLACTKPLGFSSLKTAHMNAGHKFLDINLDLEIREIY